MLGHWDGVERYVYGKSGCIHWQLCDSYDTDKPQKAKLWIVEQAKGAAGQGQTVKHIENSSSEMRMPPKCSGHNYVRSVQTYPWNMDTFNQDAMHGPSYI